MTGNSKLEKAEDRKGRLGFLKVFGIIVATIIVTVIATLWIAKTYIFPSEFKPVELSVKEEKELSAKLQRLDRISGTEIAPKANNRAGSGTSGSKHITSDYSEESFKPAAYSEADEERTISFSQRELNSMIAKNSDLAKKLAIDLSEDLVSARVRVPVDPDFPVLGGKVIRVHVGLALAYENAQPVVALRGVKLMGVPIPNAWLGGIKNIDLIKEFGVDQGFWKTFADGVAAIKVEQGRLRVEFKE